MAYPGSCKRQRKILQTQFAGAHRGKLAEDALAAQERGEAAHDEGAAGLQQARAGGATEALQQLAHELLEVPVLRRQRRLRGTEV